MSDAELLRFGYRYLKMVLLLEDAAQMKEEMKSLVGILGFIVCNGQDSTG